MSAQFTQPAPQSAARMAGLLYLIIAVFGMFSIGYMPANVFVFGDAAANAAQMTENAGLFRLGVFADMVVIICEVFVTSILFTLMKPAGETLSFAAAMTRFGMIGIMALNLLNYLVPAHLLSGADYLDVFTTEQLQALAMLLLDAHELGVYAWQIFFGLHLVALGYLVFISGYLPRLLGAMMFVGSFGYSLQAIEKFVLPGNLVLTYTAYGLLAIVTIGEVGFALWLLIKGVNAEKWQALQVA